MFFHHPPPPEQRIYNSCRLQHSKSEASSSLGALNIWIFKAYRRSPESSSEQQLLYPWPHFLLFLLLWVWDFQT